VTDAAGAPLAHASISAEGSGLSATSDDQGRYELRGLGTGVYTLRVRLLGYQPRTARVVLDQGAVTQDFALTAQPISLSPVDVVVKEGEFTPFLNTSVGRYHTANYPDDGTTVNLNGGWGIGVGRGSLGLFAEFLDRQPTNRAWADIYEDAGTGVADSIVNGK